jgi:hypothetical protein
MSGGREHRVVCRRCGSENVRSSRPRGLAEQVARGVGGVRFHVCNACGARGYHPRRRARRVAPGGPPGRPREARDLRAARARAGRRIAMLLVATLLGGGLGIYAASCGERSSPPGDAAR